jgi:hypothetical protein
MARVVQRGRSQTRGTRLVTAAPSGTSRKSRRDMPDPDLQGRGTVPHHMAAAIEGVSVASGTLTAPLPKWVETDLSLRQPFPVYPRQRTLCDRPAWSFSCQ